MDRLLNILFTHSGITVFFYNSYFHVCYGIDSGVFSQQVVTRHNCVLSKQPIKSLN